MVSKAYDPGAKVGDGKRKLSTGAGHEHQRCWYIEVVGERSDVLWRKLTFDENLSGVASSADLHGTIIEEIAAHLSAMMDRVSRWTIKLTRSTVISGNASSRTVESLRSVTVLPIGRLCTW